ncbi:MAG: hypothetical protein ACRDNK_00705, partial [Solirubrobacteraceae bacterium]
MSIFGMSYLRAARLAVLTVLVGLLVAGAGAAGARGGQGRVAPGAAGARQRSLGENGFDEGLSAYGTFARGRGPAAGGVFSPSRAARARVRPRAVVAQGRALGDTLGPEVASFRTQYSRTYVSSSGNYVARIFTAPVNYRDALGAWQ